MILKIDETAKDSTLSVNSENVNYALTNILDSRLTRTFRTVAGITTVNIVFDAGSAINVTSICIANHNITSGATIKLQGNATDSWGSPSVDETVTWNAGIIKKDISQETYRYWRISIVDGSNPDTYIEIGRAWIGDLFNTAFISPVFGHTRNSMSEKSSPFGQTYLDKRGFRSMVSVRFPWMTQAEKANLITQFEIVDIGTPFFVTFDETDMDVDTLYVTMDQEGLNFNIKRNPAYYESALSMIEEID